MSCKTLLKFFCLFFFLLPPSLSPSPLVFTLRRFNDEVKHIKVIEKDSWIHITEAKKFESLLVGSSTAHAFMFAQQICTGSLRVNSSCAALCCCGFVWFFFPVKTGAGGVLSGPFTQRELQVVGHHPAIPLQVERTLANSGQHPITR